MSRPGSLKSPLGRRNRSHKWVGLLAAAAVLALAAGPLSSAGRVLAAGRVAAAGRALAAEPFERLMPDGAVVYVHVQSVPDLLDKVKACPTYKLISEPAMQKALEPFTEAVQEPRADLARMLGRDPEQLREMLAGQICVGVFPRGQRDAHFLVLADVRSDPQMAEAVVQSLLKDAREDDGKYAVKEESFRGRTIHVIEPLKQEKPKQEAPPPPAELVPPGDQPEEWDEEQLRARIERYKPPERQENPGFITVSDGILAIASSPDRSLIEKHIALREGGEVPSVGASATWRRLDSYMGAGRDVSLVVDLGEWGKEEEEGFLGPDLGDMLGAGVLSGLGFGLTLQPDGASVQGIVLAPAPITGVLRAFASQGGSVLPPAFVDKDPGLFGGMHFSLPIMWEELMAAMQRESPEAYMMFQESLRTQPVDVENSIIKAFGDRWFFYMPPLGAGEQLSRLQVAVCADLENSAAFAQAWDQLMAQLPESVTMKTVDFEGVKLYQFTVGEGLGPDGGPVAAPCAAILQDKFLYAGSLDLAKTAIVNDKRNASPLLAEAGFQKLLGRTIENPDAVFMLDGRLIVRWAEAAMKAQHEMQAQPFQEDQPDQEAPQPENPAEQLPWDVIEKYMTTSIFTAKWVEDGVLIKSWSPDPEQ